MVFLIGEFYRGCWYLLGFLADECWRAYIFFSLFDSFQI